MKYLLVLLIFMSCSTHQEKVYRGYVHDPFDELPTVSWGTPLLYHYSDTIPTPGRDSALIIGLPNEAPLLTILRGVKVIATTDTTFIMCADPDLNYGLTPEGDTVFFTFKKKVDLLTRKQ